MPHWLNHKCATMGMTMMATTTGADAACTGSNATCTVQHAVETVDCALHHLLPCSLAAARAEPVRGVDIQSHTYWHPNFKHEKAHLDATAYEKLVDSQLQKSKAVLQRKTGKNIDMLAWPYGIFDDELLNHARQSGYFAGFTLERRPAARGDNLLALPRYLITDQVQFEKLLATPRE